MTKDQNIPATELSDDDLDQVQGAGSKYDMAHEGKKGVVLSSETHEPNFKRTEKGVVLSSETHEPAKGIVLSSESHEPTIK